MKKLIARYWGIALVLAVLVGLLVPAAPVSAGDTAWSTVATPSTGGTKITTNTSVDFLEVAADGKTMFTYDNLGMKLRRSTDGGMTWSTAQGALGTGLNGKTLTAFALSSGYATDNTLMAADFAGGVAVVYMSTDGGMNWFSPFALPITTVMVVTLAVGPDYQGGTRAEIGTADGAGGGALFSWISRTFTITNESAGTLGAGDVIAAAMSPSFLADGQLLALVATAAGTTLNAKLAANAWNASTNPVGFTGIVAAVGMRAKMAFGADYQFSANPIVLVGFSGSASDDLYRARVGTAPVQTAADLGISGAATVTPVNSIAVKGNLSDGTVYVGLVGAATVAKATGVSGTAVWSAPSLKGPLGNNAIVRVTAGGLIVGTGGNFAAIPAVPGSAIYLSTDDNATYNLVSMVSWTSTAAVTFTKLAVVDSNTYFVLATEASGYSVVYKTTDGGTTWMGIFASATQVLGVYPSPMYATDSTVYIPLTNLTVYKSVNGGTSFSIAIVGGTAPMTAFVAVDGTNFFAGSAGGLIYKSNRFVTFGTIAQNANSIAVGSNGNVVVGGILGEVYVSTNDGVTFTAQTAGGVGAIDVVLDPNYATNGVIYAADAGTVATGVRRLNPLPVQLDTAPVMGTAAVVSNDGNLYYGGLVVRRALNPTIGATAGAQGWDTMTNANLVGWPAGANVLDMGIVNTLISGTAYVHDLYALVNGVAADATYPYAGRLVVVSDKLTNPVALATPANNSNISTSQNFTWTAYPNIPAGVAVRYDVQFASDAAFTLGAVMTAAPVAGTLLSPLGVAAVVGLVPGSTYYWRVRVAAATPLLSNWSPGSKFTVKLLQSGNDITGGINSQIAPAPGATGVAVKPTFSWASVDQAVSYNLQVADNPVFVNPLDNQTGLNTNVWLETKTLDPGKTYYWRIQAVTADGIVSDWFQYDFTTAVPPPTAPTPTVTVTAPAQPPITLPAQTVTVTPPPSPKFFDPASGLYFNTQAELQQYQAQHATPATPATPAYIWVIIVIGAVLIIAVIVLIARTRRV
jgi:hypothetical protein